MDSSETQNNDINTLQKKISVFSDEYKARRKQQMLRFAGATALTLICAKMAFRGIASRKYVPNMFQLNHKRPPFSHQGEALSSFGFGTGLAVGGFSMLVFGTCWIANISNFPEFTLRVQEAMAESGTPSKKYSFMTLDKESKEVAEMLDSLIQGGDKK
ncbi:HHL127Wp [Eremothecium sinecaudum]|uniref:Altered inheritance of mitochondria protein 11 n=1 Tax=Eremothecium sinecaudum TaxID=45286 RepID=A0A0X8HWE1_9SACH|nr:HHL127Wp [Eremothecium sinecaudum]AMD22643.1 HHL127Wp [Eremothecium sinecaudum]